MKTLWLDLGNTRLKYWLTHNGSVLEFEAQQHLQAPAELLLGLSGYFKQLQPEFIGVSSVLGDKINQCIQKTLQKLNIPFELVSVDQQHDCMHSLYSPEQLGVDRWLQMLAVSHRYQNVCVVGCGTALTIDLITNKKHMGGYIFPSIYLQREALQAGTRQISIPNQVFDSTSPGLNTADAVHKGILLSVVGAINTIVQENPNHILVMTGGDAQKFAQHINAQVTIIDDLLLQGMQTYFESAI